MSKGLRNIKDLLEKENVIQRRLREQKGGLGYLSALDFSEARKQGKLKPTPPEGKEVE